MQHRKCLQFSPVSKPSKFIYVFMGIGVMCQVFQMTNTTKNGCLETNIYFLVLKVS